MERNLGERTQGPKRREGVERKKRRRVGSLFFGVQRRAGRSDAKRRTKGSQGESNRGGDCDSGGEMRVHRLMVRKGRMRRRRGGGEATRARVVRRGGTEMRDAKGRGKGERARRGALLLGDDGGSVLALSDDLGALASSDLLRGGGLLVGGSVESVGCADVRETRQDGVVGQEGRREEGYSPDEEEEVGRDKRASEESGSLGSGTVSDGGDLSSSVGVREVSVTWRIREEKKVSTTTLAQAISLATPFPSPSSLALELVRVSSRHHIPLPRLPSAPSSLLPSARSRVPSSASFADPLALPSSSAPFDPKPHPKALFRRPLNPLGPFFRTSAADVVLRLAIVSSRVACHRATEADRGRGEESTQRFWRARQQDGGGRRKRRAEWMARRRDEGKTRSGKRGRGERRRGKTEEARKGDGKRRAGARGGRRLEWEEERSWEGRGRGKRARRREEGGKRWPTVGEKGPACDVDDADVDDELGDLHGGEVLLPLFGSEKGGKVRTCWRARGKDANEPRASCLRQWRSSSSLRGEKGWLGVKAQRE